MRNTINCYFNSIGSTEFLTEIDYIVSQHKLQKIMRLFRLLSFINSLTRNLPNIASNIALVLTIATAISLPITEKVQTQPQKDATEWIKQGRQLWQKNNISGAIAAYQQASKLEPKNSKILTSLGFLLTQQSNYSDAIAALERATKLDANNAKAFSALGFVYVRIKDYPSALKSYRQAIALDRENIDAYNSVGFLLTEQKNYAEAAKIYRQAIAVVPNDPKSYISLGYVLQLMGDRKGAFEIYSQADKIAPFNADILVAIGGLFADQNQLNEAIAKYKRALEINPRHPQANLEIAKIYQGEGKYTEAISFLRRAIAAKNITPSVANKIQNAIADLYIQQGSLSGAIVAYRQILETDPEDAETHLALGKLLAAQQRGDRGSQDVRNCGKFV